MNYLQKTLGSGAGLAVVLSFVTIGWSEDKGKSVARELQNADIPATRVMTPQENDHRIARWLTIDNRMILDCARLAKDKSERTDVRSFAEMVVAEHEKTIDELTAISGKKSEKAVSPSGKKESVATNDKDGHQKASGLNTLGDNSPDRSRTAVLVHDYGTSRDSRMIFQPTDFLAVREDVFNKLSDVTKKEWESVSGPEFDRAFLKHQIIAHEQLISTIQTIRPTASASMHTFFDRQLEKLKGHLQQARNLVDESVKTTSR